MSMPSKIISRSNAEKLATALTLQHVVPKYAELQKKYLKLIAEFERDVYIPSINNTLRNVPNHMVKSLSPAIIYKPVDTTNIVLEDTIPNFPQDRHHWYEAFELTYERCQGVSLYTDIPQEKLYEWQTQRKDKTYEVIFYDSATTGDELVYPNYRHYSFEPLGGRFNNKLRAINCQLSQATLLSMSYRMPNIVCGDKHKRLFESMYRIRLGMYDMKKSADQLANELLAMIVASRTTKNVLAAWPEAEYYLKKIFGFGTSDSHYIETPLINVVKKHIPVMIAAE